MKGVLLKPHWLPHMLLISHNYQQSKTRPHNHLRSTFNRSHKHRVTWCFHDTPIGRHSEVCFPHNIQEPHQNMQGETLMQPHKGFQDHGQQHACHSAPRTRSLLRAIKQWKQENGLNLSGIVLAYFIFFISIYFFSEGPQIIYNYILCIYIIIMQMVKKKLYMLRDFFYIVL